MEASDAQEGQLAAERVLHWLEHEGGREKVQEAIQKAIAQTKVRNKARYLDPKFLNERITI